MIKRIFILFFIPSLIYTQNNTNAQIIAPPPNVNSTDIIKVDEDNSIPKKEIKNAQLNSSTNTNNEDLDYFSTNADKKPFSYVLFFDVGISRRGFNQNAYRDFLLEEENRSLDVLTNQQTFYFGVGAGFVIKKHWLTGLHFAYHGLGREIDDATNAISTGTDGRSVTNSFGFEVGVVHAPVWLDFGYYFKDYYQAKWNFFLGLKSGISFLVRDILFFNKTEENFNLISVRSDTLIGFGFSPSFRIHYRLNPASYIFIIYSHPVIVRNFVYHYPTVHIGFEYGIHFNYFKKKKKKQ